MKFQTTWIENGEEFVEDVENFAGSGTLEQQICEWNKMSMRDFLKRLNTGQNWIKTERGYCFEGTGMKIDIWM